MRYCKDCFTPNRDHEVYCRKCSASLYRRVRDNETIDLWPRFLRKRNN